MEAGGTIQGDLAAFATALVRVTEKHTEELARMRRAIDLHSETLRRIERKLDQHRATVEPDPAVSGDSED